jgi:hypothetical protein
LALAAIPAGFGDIDFAHIIAGEARLHRNYAVSIGHGLAAPPPPATGPPILI